MIEDDKIIDIPIFGVRPIFIEISIYTIKYLFDL